MQEILVMIVVALALFALPRILGKRPESEPMPIRAVRRRPALTGRMRLAILLTLFWILGAAALLEPWQSDIFPFLYVGLAPPAALWGATWVWFGYRKYRR
jgi:hypothetical protein